MKGHSHLISPPWTAPEVSILIFFVYQTDHFLSFKKNTFASYRILSTYVIFSQHFKGIFPLLLASMFLMRSHLLFLLLWGVNVIFFPWLFLKNILFIYILERGRQGEREGEKHQCVTASCMPPAGDLACNPGMFPDWESNQ